MAREEEVIATGGDHQEIVRATILSETDVREDVFGLAVAHGFPAVAR